MMPKFRRSLIYGIAAALVAVLPVIGVFAQGTPLQTATPLEKAVAAVGGEEALSELTSLALEVNGVRWVFDEGFEPGGAPVRIGAYTETVSIDVAQGNLRVEQTKETLGAARDLIEVVTREGGYLDGLDGRFGQPTQQAMRSDRLASTIKQQRLLNPHLLLQEMLADPTSVTDAGEVLDEGAVYHRLAVANEPAPLLLYIHAGTGQLAKLTTTEEMPLRRDVALEVFYYHWQPIGERGLTFPAEVYIALDGEIVVKEVRSQITVNPALSADLFAIPAEIEMTPDETLAARGAANHQYLQMFAHYGFIRDGLQTNLAATEVAPGIYHLTGGSHHSLAVAQDDGIVIIETPLGGYRSDLIMDWVAETFPDKPITHAVVTHHHEDHAAGLREFAATGATAVVHEAAAPFFARIFDAPATISPDRMVENPAEVTMAVVPADESLTLPDSTHAVTIYPIEQTHAEDMIIAYVAEPGIVFVSDLYSPNPDADSAGAGGQLIADAIAMHGLDVAWVVGGHGGAISMADFERQLGQ
ncbi:MAG: MBL fold metallo-hydrolase [Caldilineaceae bacterium]